MSEPRSAYDITNPMIKGTGAAIRDGDFDAFMKHFNVPLILETYEGKMILNNRHEVERHFHGVRKFRAEKGVVDSRRENVLAEFHCPKTIALIHVSHLLLADGSVFDRPYPTYSVIRMIGGRWLTCYCQYAVGDHDAFTRALMMFRENP
ncbi:MAG: hypothetical protein AAFR73_02975 [Pseudomonadota bacterium]